MLTIGLVGMGLMLTVVITGNRGSSTLAGATNLCQLKIEELSDIEFALVGSRTSTSPAAEKVYYGLTSGQMAQESSINEFGNTWDQQLSIESTTTGSVCFGLSGINPSQDNDCADLIRSLGPYHFTRTFVICKGSDYLPTPPPSPTPYPTVTPTPPPNTQAMAVTPIEGSERPQIEPNCRVDPSNNNTRVLPLACLPTDILQNPGPTNPEKKIKVLCTWRSKSGACNSATAQSSMINVSSN